MGRLKHDVVKEATTKFTDAFGTKIDETLRAFDNINQKRFSSIEAELEAIKREQRATAARNQEMQDATSRLQKETATADAHAAPQPVFDAQYDKPPETTVVNINSASAVELEAMEAVIRDWVAIRDDLRNNWDLFAVGRPIRGAPKRFVLRFRGEGTVGPRRAAQFLTLPKVAGTWNPVFMQYHNQPVQLYISEEKSRRTIKAERALKQLKLIILEESKVPEDRLWVNKQDWGLVLDGRRLLRADPWDTPRTPCELDWKRKYAQSIPIDLDRVAKRFCG